MYRVMTQALAPPRQATHDEPILLDAESAGRIFELIGQSDLIDRGLALLVSIASVKAALGERWTHRREQIHSLTGRYLAKHLQPGDICERADEVHFLIAMPEVSAVAAQAACYRALQEVLSYFLGEVKPADLHVSQVCELGADDVRLRRFTLAELRRADAAAPAPGSRPPPLPPQTSLSNLASWPLKAADGQDLRVSFAVDPVMDLKAWGMAGHRIEARIVDLQTGVELTTAQRRSLLPRDFEQIDLAALERALSRIEGVESFERPRLIIQISFASLSNSRARAALLARAREWQHVLRHAAICELVDVEPGVPMGRLSDVTSLVRGFFRSVWVQVELSRITIDAACSARASGLTVRAQDLGETPEQIAEGTRRFISLVNRRSVLLTVTSLPTTDLMIDAMVAGFTHATLRAAQPQAAAQTPEAPPSEPAPAS
jgi:hypothetical protein